MTTTIACLGLTALAAILLLTKVIRNREWHVRSQKQRTFDPARYHALERLLDDADIEFLHEYGASRAAIRRYRSARTRAARLYLRSIRLDFDFFWRRAQIAVALSPELHAAFAGDLVRLKLGFQWTLVRLHCRLTLAPLMPARTGSGAIAPAIESLRRLWELPGAVAAATAATPA